MEDDLTETQTSPAPESAPRAPSFPVAQTLKALVALTVISAGSGGFLGSIMGAGAPVEPRSAGDKGAASADGHSETVARQSLVVRELPPIVTNLAVPETSWVRLQAAIVYDATAVPNPEPLVTELMSDIVAFLRTVSLASLEGADGLRSLREDLSERATVRSEGRVREFVIQALVVQ